MAGHFQDSPGVERVRNRDGRGGRLGRQHQSDLVRDAVTNAELIVRGISSIGQAPSASPFPADARTRSRFRRSSLPPRRSRRQASPRTTYPFGSIEDRSAECCKAIHETSAWLGRRTQRCLFGAPIVLHTNHSKLQTAPQHAFALAEVRASARLGQGADSSRDRRPPSIRSRCSLGPSCRTKKHRNRGHLIRQRPDQ
jgi:hypothetical protein